ncbi:MAG: glycosyl hydrolase family 28-related protein [Bacteroidota bacterium]
MSVSITSFGAVADGTTNNHDAIQNAINYAQAHGDSVYIPAGTFAYSGTLTATGITVSGAGDASILKALDPANQSFILKGDGGSLHDFHLEGNTSAGRLMTFQSGMIWVSGATNYTVQNMHIHGSASVGIVSDKSSYGKVLNNTVENTLADSIHTVTGSHDILISGNRVVHSGDDGISVVSYNDQPIVHDITVQGNTVLYNDWGRGLSVVGGNAVKILGNHVEGGKADVAGVYIAAESEYHTLGVSNVTVSGNTLINTGGVSTGHGSITVYNSQGGSTAITGVVLDHNQIVNPRSDAVLYTGAGSIQSSLTYNNVYSDGHKIMYSVDPAATVSQTGNTSYALSSYGTPLVPSGGGVGTGTTSGGGTGTGTGGGTGTDTGSSSISDTGTIVPLPTGIADASHPVSGAPAHFVTALNTSAQVNGTAGNDQITGLKGVADTEGLAGGKGDDIYVVDHANDKVVELAGEGVDTVVSSATSTTLAANVENLVMTATTAATGIGNDGNNILVANDAGAKLYGGLGNDLLHGGKGADLLDGGAGNDTMKGGLSNDTYVVNSTGDVVVELSNQGVDLVQSSITYKLGSYVEDLVLTGTGNINGTGTDYHNLVQGNDGNNILSGLGGNDTMVGGKGNDVLIGGSGYDTFVLKTPGTGFDTIKDFNTSQDNLNVQAVLKAVGASTVSQALQSHLMEVVQSGSSANVMAHVNNAVIKVAVVENMTVANLLKTADHWG